MKLVSQRSLSDLQLVLMDKDSSGPDPVYEVFTEINQPPWVNQTVIQPGKIGREYPKTFGHYHGVLVDETYRLVEGAGVLILQKRRKTNDEKLMTNEVERVILVKMKPGDEVIITPEWGHSWSNTRDMPLISYDNWSAGHSDSDYQLIRELGGMSYFLVEENREAVPVKNPNYNDLPEPVWMTPAEFNVKMGA